MSSVFWGLNGKLLFIFADKLFFVFSSFFVLLLFLLVLLAELFEWLICRIYGLLYPL